MKTIFKTLLLMLSMAPSCLMGQTNIFPATGNVGIGTATPLFKLDVAGVISSGYTYQQSIASPDNNYTRSNFGSNAYWDEATKKWVVRNIGANDFSNIIHPNGGGISFVTSASTGTSDISLTHSSFMSNVRMHISSTGNVGIGTATPGSKLVIMEGAEGVSLNSVALGFNRNVLDGQIFNSSKSAWQFTSRNDRFTLEGYNGPPLDLFTVLKNGNVGIGTATPWFKLDVAGTIASGFTYMNSPLETGTVYTRSCFGSNVYWNSSSQTWDVRAIGANDFSAMIHPNADGLAFVTTGSLANAARSLTNTQFMSFERMRINAAGNVLIGKTTQTNAAYKLDVSGPIRANEVVVNTTGADFVFEENYSLKKLEDVEAFIKTHKHLPEVAPACDMQTEGVEVGKLNTQLLQKVEELTLYLIEANKSIQEANKTIKKQNERLENLEAVIKKK